MDHWQVLIDISSAKSKEVPNMLSDPNLFCLIYSTCMAHDTLIENLQFTNLPHRFRLSKQVIDMKAMSKKFQGFSLYIVCLQPVSLSCGQSIYPIE